MELENRTPYPAGIFRTIIGESDFAASVLARATFDIGAGGALVPAREQPWIVSAKPWDCEYGPMDSDECFYKGGVDLFVFGQACAPGGGTLSEMEVELEVGGSFRRAVKVFGERRWRKSGRKLVATAPQPFTRMALGLENAFGGKQSWDGLELSYPHNPLGKGYYLERDAALDQPLPNLEEPQELIRSWEDRPAPAGLGLCSPQSPLRFFNGMRPRQGGGFDFQPSFFNAAFPRMIAPRVAPGDRVRLSGVRPEGPLEFVVPTLELAVRLRFGDGAYERPLAIDQLGVEAERRRAFIAWRFPFRYTLVARQARGCELVVRDAGARRSR